MSNSHFQFKQFTIHQDRCAMKVTTDACLFGAVVADEIGKSKTDAQRILDIGTGTGLLSLMIAQKSNAAIDAIEIDGDAAVQAGENVTGSPWKDRIKIIGEDVKNFKFQHQYDHIISNPPFYENELASPDAKKNLALHNHGLSLGELFPVIKNNLAPAGTFYLLLPFKRYMEIKAFPATYNCIITDSLFIRQSINHGYFRVIIKGRFHSSHNQACVSNELSIRDTHNQYTPAFTTLLQDYYLRM